MSNAYIYITNNLFLHTYVYRKKGGNSYKCSDTVVRQTSLSLSYTKPISFILCHFWTEIERDRKQYSVLSIGHIHTRKEGGGGLRVLASMSISVRIDLKSGMKVCEILLQTVYSDLCLVARGVSQLLLFYLQGSNHFNEKGGGVIFPPIFNTFFLRASAK